jgi:nucleotide-binding universal stress UspA family protein
MNEAPRPRCIVVGVDGTGTRDNPVLTAALDQASWSDAELCLVHVLPAGSPETDTPNGAGTRRRDLAARTARIHIMTAELRQYFAEHLAEDRVDTAVRFDVRYGDPATMLLAAAQQAALIVVGTRHPASRHSPFLLGPVSQDIALNAACPVLLIPIAISPA